MFTFDGLLFLILVIVLPIFIYHLLLTKRVTSPNSETTNSIILGIVCSISIVISMTYPINVAPQHIFDLRTVPWIIAVLYGGYRSGVLVTVVIVVYRYYIGGDGYYIALFSYSISLFITLFFVKRFNLYSRTQKMWYAIFLTSIKTIFIFLGVLYFIDNFSKETIYQFYFYFTLVQLVAVSLVIYLIEILQEKERLKHEIHRTEKLQAVGQLAASVAHEIRNPMTTVRGFMQLFQGADNLSNEQKKHIKIMMVELDRAQAIISDYLSLAKPEADHVERVDLKDHINLVIDIMSSYALLNEISLENSVEQSCYILANKEKLNQVFVNIIKNSIEATPRGGTVKIIVSQNGNCAIIDIIDTGNGLGNHGIL